ncbi:Rho-binding antiterminator [Alteromonas flava]|uniref:Rho-binding antiterminator n=1 Tax=Alteromonas flava TaxID=2048003 RepID=UPI000C284BA4|nr:Rho-binding antiterminator [Alteromonas flava]
MITCDQYDYIEIVCLFHYPVEIKCKSGAVVSGCAMDIQKDSHRNECILITTLATSQLIPLDAISSLRITVDNPHFSEVSFQA